MTGFRIKRSAAHAMNQLMSLPPVKNFDRLKHYYTSIAIWTAAWRADSCRHRLFPPHTLSHRAAVARHDPRSNSPPYLSRQRIKPLACASAAWSRRP